jgi:hypothetical protein
MRRLADVIGLTEGVLLASLLTYSLINKGVSPDLLFGLFLAPTAATGWIVASRVPSNPIGWLLLFISGCFLFTQPFYGLADALGESAPGVAAWAYWLAGTDDWAWIWVPPIGVMATLLLLLFPDGHLPSPRWRWFSRFTALCVGGLTVAFMLSPSEFPHGLHNPTGVHWFDGHGAAIGLPLVLGMAVSVVGSIASLVIRYRHAEPMVREQLRWVAWAAGMVVLGYAASWLVPGDAADNLVATLYGLIPVSIGIAVLRFHLYEIDRIISRTVSYAVVTAALLLMYAAVVTVVSRLVPVSSAVAVAAATLAAAALLRPLLSRTRELVDRRFNRSRYDAERTVEAFSTGLRTAVDADVVLTELVRTTREAVQPQTLAVWVPEVRIR